MCVCVEYLEMSSKLKQNIFVNRNMTSHVSSDENIVEQTSEEDKKVLTERMDDSIHNSILLKTSDRQDMHKGLQHFLCLQSFVQARHILNRLVSASSLKHITSIIYT